MLILLFYGPLLNSAIIIEIKRYGVELQRSERVMNYFEGGVGRKGHYLK